MSKRIFDFLVSLFLILLLSPVFIIISFIILIDSKGPVLYRQKRVGKNNLNFMIYKFRTMKSNAEEKGLLTVGSNDARITRTGFFLRKYKLDELPQLFNVLAGNMSITGPRPEVRKYVNLYNAQQLKVLDALPGITDYASLAFSNENELLGKAADPEQEYIHKIMPAKLNLNLKYLKEKSLFTDLKIITKTLYKIFFKR